jgi:peptidyl-prolyl cis-trans isomerase C
MTEIENQCQRDLSKLPHVFAQIARRDSECPSTAQGGDLGVFSPKTMVPEFDEAVFGDTPPLAGTSVGPVITDFGAHLIVSHWVLS